MKVIAARNVHQALVEGAYQMRHHGVARESRNGPVLQLPLPLTTVYMRPTERVVQHPERDANPFFHFMESLWMLDGRRDVAWVQQFNSKIGSYSDDGEKFNGAYGHRWRHHFGGDQIKKVVDALRQNPDCRRQVVSMWDGHHDLGLQSKDLPCNTQIFFQRDADGRLAMMVTNRSNDLVWGAYGANAVHFSFLQEFVAASLGWEVGFYHQVSMNTHLYVEQHETMMRLLADKAPDPPQTYTCPYSDGKFGEPHPLMSIPASRWLRELRTFVEHGDTVDYADPFFRDVASPLLASYVCFKDRSLGEGRFDDAYRALGACAATDWRIAATEWLQRREAV